MGRWCLLSLALALGLAIPGSPAGAQSPSPEADLNGRRDEIERELEELIDRIDELTQRETEIEERQAYVERILELRDQLQVLGPRTPLPFRLVQIDGPPDDPGYSAGATGYSYTFTQGVGRESQPLECKYYGSYRITKAPTEILPGRALELEMESIVGATGRNCTWTENRIAIFMDTLDRVHLVTPAETQSKSRLTLRLEPLCSGREDRWAGDLLFFYRVGAISSSDAGDIDIRLSAPEGITKDLDCARRIEAAGDQAMYISAMAFLPQRGVYRGDYHAQSSDDGATIRFQFKFSSRMVGSIDLVYRTDLEDGSWIAALPAYEHPEVPTGSSDDAIVAAQGVADVIGLPAQSAKAALEAKGFAVDIEVGAPARSRIDAFRVASQRPAAGAEAKPGERVRLTIHGDWVAPTTAVPDLFGLPAEEAKSVLENRGFTVEISVGAAAPSAADEFTVASQVPSPMTELDRGETVRVTVHGRYETPKPAVDTTRSGGSRDRSGSSTQGRLPGKGPVSSTPGSFHRGSELRNFRCGTPQECRQACSVDERCVGFSWAEFTPPAGSTGPLATKLPAHCTLFGSVTGKRECRDPGLECVSGLKEVASSTTGGGESSSEPDAPGLEGVWQSTWGPVDFTVGSDGTVRGSYGRRNGRIIARFDGRVLEGVWVKDLADRCATRQDGSGYWGRVRFELDAQTGTFAGVYGYCDEPMNAGWKLHR